MSFAAVLLRVVPNIAQVLKQFIGAIGQCIVIIIERGILSKSKRRAVLL